MKRDVTCQAGFPGIPGRRWAVHSGKHLSSFSRTICARHEAGSARINNCLFQSGCRPALSLEGPSNVRSLCTWLSSKFVVRADPRRRHRRALLAATPAFAATWTWDGGEPGGNHWTNTLNWNPDTTPANNGTADLIFGGTTRLTPDMNANWNVNSVTFNNTAGAFTLNSIIGATLTVGAGGITNNDADNQTINHAITLGAAQTWTAAAGSLDIYGAINNGGNLLTINAARRRSVIDGVLSGSGGLTKNGLGRPDPVRTRTEYLYGHDHGQCRHVGVERKLWSRCDSRSAQHWRRRGDGHRHRDQ